MIREKEILEYLNGSASSELKDAIRTWAKESKENQETLDFYTKVWSSEFYENSPIDFGTESAWSAIEGSLQESTSESTSTTETVQEKTSTAKVIPMWKKALSVAASLLLVGTIFFLMQDRDPYNYVETATDPMEITLEDGSIVQLAENSSLKYPKNFDAFSERAVDLTGIGTFDIRKDAEKAFVVNSNGTSVKVLGTIFKLESNSEETAVENIEGLIKFYLTGDENSGQVLKEGEKAVFKGGKIERILPEPEPVKEEPVVEPVKEEPEPEPVKEEPVVEPVKEEPEPEPVKEEPFMLSGKEIFNQLKEKFPNRIARGPVFSSGEGIVLDKDWLIDDLDAIIADLEQRANVVVQKPGAKKIEKGKGTYTFESLNPKDQ